MKVGELVKYSNYYLQLLRGNYRKKAEVEVFQVLNLNEISVTVRPAGTEQKYGTQKPRKYFVLFEEEVKADQNLICRFCLRPVTKDTEGVEPDIDPVTGEHSGFRHSGCQPDFKVMDSSTPTPV